MAATERTHVRNTMNIDTMRLSYGEDQLGAPALAADA
jgi:hypothetical protein